MSNSFWEFLWLILSVFFLFAYLLVMFQIVVDLFRDHKLSGFAKALWIIALIFIPLVTALVYVIARGRGMGQRQLQAEQQAKAEVDTYIRQAAGTSPAEQIARANALLKEGTINEQEFATLKAKALG
ncbi:PLDc N-terminal domain-containing protein [Devosia sp. ZB163]|uniref:PLDc N-terminal domain-containing protein n=1 Tax=Devosia sp. ZB163 TaxID=3025938 RepID=UPI0023620494|nr:PLDc N-terminal domain-containing protein [Devosia sp. ZB163]MDC9823509.1 PLDc N-terminal domain-containing protein [Devosia sp. ZB163]